MAASAASAATDCQTASAAVQIDIILVELSCYDDGSLSSSDADLDSDLMAELYSDKVTSLSEIQSWALGMVPYGCPETLRRELKAFQLVTSTDASVSGLSEHMLQQMFETSDFSVLRSHSIRRLHQMIEYYVPKYFTSFMNTEIKKAEFLIGLTDDGEVTGAIVPSDLEQSDLRDMVWSQIEMTIRSQGSEFGGSDVIDHYLEHVREAMKVEMVEIDPDVSLVDDWSEEFLRCQSAKVDEYQTVRNAYLSKMARVSRRMAYYRRSVAEMINDPLVHDEFIEFIRTHVPNSTDVSPDLREAIIDRVRRTADDPVTYVLGQISDEKSDIRNLAYWITKFRDVRVDEIRVSKPQVPIGYRPLLPYTSMMVRNPVHRLVSGISADSSMKVVVIQIEFPGQLSIPFPRCRDYHRSMMYVDSSGTHRTTVRYITSNGPSCM
jgi:hypothetical protein